MYLVSPCISLLRFGQTSNSNIKVKYVNIMRNFFSVVIPPHILRFTSSTDHYVSNQGADVLSTAGLLCTAGLLVTGRPARNAAMPVLFLLSGPKIGFCPPPGDRTFSSLSMPNFTFIGAEMWEYSPQNCQNFEFWQ